MDLNAMQKHLDQVMYDQNNRVIPEFEGYSPNEMENILYYPFELNSPIGLQKLTDSECQKIPLFNQVKYFMNLLKDNGEIKLTVKGFLPTKVVKDIYQQGYLEEFQFKNGISKLYKELDSMTVNLTRLLAEVAGLTKRRNGKLSLTKKGEKLLSDDYQLLIELLKNYAMKFNWPYYDGYGDNQIGQFGFGFSLILLNKYGHEQRLSQFYSDLYFKAFPELQEQLVTNEYVDVKEQLKRCYALRTFDRFMAYFGMIEIEKEGKSLISDVKITKTELFDKLIIVRPHVKEMK